LHSLYTTAHALSPTLSRSASAAHVPFLFMLFSHPLSLAVVVVVAAAAVVPVVAGARFLLSLQLQFCSVRRVN